MLSVCFNVIDVDANDVVATGNTLTLYVVSAATTAPAVGAKVIMVITNVLLPSLFDFWLIECFRHRHVTFCERHIKNSFYVQFSC